MVNLDKFGLITHQPMKKNIVMLNQQKNIIPFAIKMIVSQCSEKFS